MIRRLRRRFVGIAMASLLVILAGVIGFINITSWQQMNLRADDLLEFLAEHGGEFPRPEEHALSTARPDFMRNQETAFKTRCFSVRYTAEGEVEEVRIDRIAAIDEQGALECAQQALETGRERGFVGIYRFLVQESDGQIYVGFLDMADEITTARQLAGASAFVAVFCLAAMFVMVFFFSKRAIRPIVQNLERQKQFIADAGHEIKTPLTILSANAAVLRMTVGENEWVDSIQNQTRRLDKLVGELLSLSQVESGLSRQVELFCLSDAVLDTASAFRTMAEAQGKTLRISVEPEIFYCGDETQLRGLVSILMDNAVKYATKDAEISLRLYKKKHSLLLEVQNPCEPIAPEALPRLFDRFYRADNSRARESGSYGIGLAIAREIVLASKGKISAFCPKEGEIVFRVTL